MKVSLLDCLFHPERMNARDDEGWCWHVDLSMHCWYDGDPADEIPINPDYVRAAGYELQWTWPDDDLDEYTEGGGCSRWDPQPPEEHDGWWLIGVVDSEDGPGAVWVRKVKPQLALVYLT